MIHNGKSFETAAQELLPDEIEDMAIDACEGLVNEKSNKARSCFELMLLAYWRGRLDHIADGPE